MASLGAGFDGFPSRMLRTCSELFSIAQNCSVFLNIAHHCVAHSLDVSVGVTIMFSLYYVITLA